MFLLAQVIFVSQAENNMMHVVGGEQKKPGFAKRGLIHIIITISVADAGYWKVLPSRRLEGCAPNKYFSSWVSKIAVLTVYV